MRKFERKCVVRLGFNSAGKEPVEVVMDIEPEHHILEMLADMNHASYIEVFTRFVPVVVQK